MEITCPISGNTIGDCHFVTRPGSVRDAPECGVKECMDCGLVMHKKDLSALVNYVENSMNSWEQGYQDLSPSLSDTNRRVNTVRSLLPNLNSQKYRILDFGCGKGDLLEIFSTFADVYGLEPNNTVRNKITSEFKEFIIFSDIDQMVNSRLNFDVVTMFHVIEHLTEPDKILQSIRSVLAPNGLIIIETPNAQDALLTVYKNASFQKFTYWSHHPMLYSDKSLRMLVERNRFKIIENQHCQRYSLNNHINWLCFGKPGGHVGLNEYFSAETLDNYNQDLIDRNISDTLLLIAKKIT